MQMGQSPLSVPETTSIPSSLSHGKELLLICLMPSEIGTLSFVLYLQCLAQGWVSVLGLRVAVCWWVNAEPVGVVGAGLWAGIQGGRKTWACGQVCKGVVCTQAVGHLD